MSSAFSILQWNCRSLRHKLVHLRLLVSYYSPSVICLQETHIDDRTAIADVQLNNYQLFRKDRPTREGGVARGGVAIYVHLTLPCSGVTLNSSLEVVACRVKFNDMDLVVCSAYCPSGVALDNDELDALHHHFGGRNSVILGDFNAHHCVWGSQRSDGRGRQMMDFIAGSDLVILNDGSPTRVDDGTGDVSSIDLSLVSSNLATRFSWATYDDTLGSDHLPIVLSLSCDFVRTPSTPKFNYKRADWGNFSRVVKLDIVGETIDDKVNHIQDCIIAGATATIPRTSADCVKRRVPWWTPDCRRALCERNRAYRRFNRNITAENFVLYKKARARARRVIRKAKRDSWRSFVSTITYRTPGSQVWATVNRINGKFKSHRIPVLLDNNQFIDQPRDIANTLARRFAHSSSSANYDPRFLPIKESAELTPLPFATEDIFDYNRPFSMHELERALGACKGTSAGPDEIHYDMIKRLNRASTIILLEVYNEIWLSGTFPNRWRFAHIIAILKPGADPKLSMSFRPIALTSCLCKVMERMINSRLLFQLESLGLLCGQQSGFRRGRSTLDHLVNLESNVNEAFANRHVLIAAFLDVEKAYDMTWRHGLLMKLYGLGFRGILPIFIQNFLTDRTFSVRLSHLGTTVMSDIFVQENGVPQGSVLSPTLFLIMINDILPAPPRNLKYSLYADDCAIWHSSNIAQFSAGRVQMALNSIHAWGQQWGFKFSAAKSVGVIFTHKLKLPRISLTLGNTPIPIKNSARFLGLHFDSRLNWTVHIEQLLVKCHRSLNLLKIISGNSWGADRHSLLMIYKALIRSKIDFGSIVYDSATDAVLERLTVFQNKCLRVCLGALKCTKIGRLELESGVPPLRLRRYQLTLQFACKVARERDHPSYEVVMSHLMVDRPIGKGPLVNRLHSICEQVGIDLSDVDTLVKQKIAPWLRPDFVLVDHWLPGPKATVPEAEVRQRFREILVRHLDHFHLYTDGSKANECVGSSVWSRECILQYKLPNHTSVFIAELFAIDKAIDFARSSTHDKVVIFTDSYSSLKAIQSLRTRSNEIQGNIIHKLFDAFVVDSKVIKLMWVPGHMGIYGNEMADFYAKGSGHLAITNIRRDPESSVSNIKSSLRLLWREGWPNLSSFTINPTVGPWVAKLPRLIDIKLTRLRLNCTRFSHLTPIMDRRFPPRCVDCDAPGNVKHALLYCSKFRQQRQPIITYCTLLKIPFTTNSLLEPYNHVLLDKLIKFLFETELFATI